jgi:hypothetical protein
MREIIHTIVRRIEIDHDISASLQRPVLPVGDRKPLAEVLLGSNLAAL